MSDGKTEAMRGTYFSGKTADQYPIGASLEEQAKHTPWEEELVHMPNQRMHKIVSFIKSGIRILGYAIIPFDLVIATGVLILSEVIGIVEELV